MSTFGEDFLKNGFKEYHTIIGGCIQAFIACERKKRDIVKNNRFISSRDMEMDGLLCEAYTVAQNEIFTELLFFYLMNSGLKSITEGVVKTVKQTRKTFKKVKALKSKKGKGGKSKRKKIESAFIGGGKDNSNKLKNILSLLILFSLKAHSENTNIPDNYHAAFKFDHTPVELDPRNDEQMEEYTKKFGKIQTGNRIPLQTENLLQMFNNEESSHYLYKTSTSEFHRDVTKQTVDLFNDNVHPVYERLLILCNNFIEKSTDTNPAEYGKIFSEITERELHEFVKKRSVYEQKIIDESRTHAVEITKIPDTFLYNWFGDWDNKKQLPSTNKNKNIRLMDTHFHALSPPAAVVKKRYTEKDKNIMITEAEGKVPALLAEFDYRHHENIARRMNEDDNQSMLELNRKKYLSGICRFSLRPPDLKYTFNETEGVISFSDNMDYRRHIEVLVRNIRTQAIREKSREGEYEYEHAIEMKAKSAKQIELADFLEEVLVEWDTSFRNVITRGHSGKKSMPEFIKGFKKEMDNLKKFMRLGLNGNPIALREALKNREDAIKNKEINNITMEARRMNHDISDEIRQFDNEVSEKDWLQFVHQNSEWFRIPIYSAFGELGTCIRSLFSFIMFDVVIKLLGMGAAIAYVVNYIRSITPFFFPAATVKRLPPSTKEKMAAEGKRLITDVINNKNINNKATPILLLKDLTDVEKQKQQEEEAREKEDATRIRNLRPNILLEKIQGIPCKKGYTQNTILKNCAPSAHNKTQSEKRHYAEWYLGSNQDIYENAQEKTKTKPKPKTKTPTPTPPIV